MSLFKLPTLLVSLGLAVSAMAGVTTSAQADTIHPAGNESLCLDVVTSRMDPATHTYPVILYPCQNSSNENFFTTAYGRQGYAHYCLDFSGNGGSGSLLIFAPCVEGKTSQLWSLVSDSSAPGAMRNQAGWCIDVPYGNASQMVQPQAYSCKSGTDWRGRGNQTWTRGTSVSVAQLKAAFPTLTPAQVADVQSGVDIIVGGNVIAAGGGNIIAAGGGNVIAAGGGNVIAAGGGNVIAAGGGNLLAADGGGMKR